MFSHTKKVGSAGRYRTTVGKKIRDEIRKIEDASRRERNCPVCGKNGVKRVSAGVWECKPCDNVFTGGAHSPKLKKPAEINLGGKQ